MLIILTAACLLVSCAGINKAAGTASPPPASFGTSLISPVTPNTGSISGDYYVVDSGGKSGIVDGLGNIILPLEFSQVVVKRNKNNPVVFLAVDGNTRIKGHGESEGGLYDAGGKKLVTGNFQNGYAINKNVLLVTDINNNYGAFSYSGKELFPCKYTQVYICSNQIVAVGEGMTPRYLLLTYMTWKGYFSAAKILKRSSFITMTTLQTEKI